MVGCSCWKVKVVPEPSPDPIIPQVPVEQSPRDGSVLVVYPNNSTYRGQFKDGKRHGHGTMVLPDGTKQEADWKHDHRHGKGTELFPDGTHFLGSYMDGLRSGHGVMTWPEGSQYSGQFEKGKANGKGVLQRTDGSVYRGQFCEDCMSGQGCMEWEDGVSYVGQFVANRREGSGKMTWASGKWQSYDGEWKNGMQHGHGTLLGHNSTTNFSGVFHWGKLARWDNAEGGSEEGPLEQPSHVPSYWDNQDLTTGFNERREVPEEFQEQVQKLLDGTFKDIRTRDRSGQQPTRLRLVKCHRVENSEMWVRYQLAKDRVLQRRPEGVCSVNALHGPPESGFVKTQQLLESQTIAHLDARVNEHFLWHGTTPAGAIGISSSGFKISLAGTHGGTYFGNGCYFAESSSKSDEYAKQGDGLLAGIYALLLCRVTCGSLFRVTQPDDSQIQQALRGGKYDAVLGDREASVGTYREFVIYEEDLAYPEYVVLYERKFEANAAEN